jgi:hypothetical protein
MDRPKLPIITMSFGDSLDLRVLIVGSSFPNVETSDRSRTGAVKPVGEQGEI